jgi:hypothetical protein
MEMAGMEVMTVSKGMKNDVRKEKEGITTTPVT